MLFKIASSAQSLTAHPQLGCILAEVLQTVRLPGAHSGSDTECHCLMQVVRGADSCLVAPEEDWHSVLRQYRAQQGSKAPVEGPCVEGESPCPLMYNVGIFGFKRIM